MNSLTASKSRMLFSPRSTRSASQSSRIQGVSVANLSQQLLSQQVSTLLDEMQTLGRQIEQRDELLEFAKANCKKRFMPSLAKQYNALQQVLRVSDEAPHKPQDWLYLGNSNLGESSSTLVEILQDDLDEDADVDYSSSQHVTHNGSHEMSQNPDFDVSDSDNGSDNDTSE
jgi:uncharacterized membrane protein YgaE (UPF0421/DUF939 family)